MSKAQVKKTQMQEQTNDNRVAQAVETWFTPHGVEDARIRGERATKNKETLINLLHVRHNLLNNRNISINDEEMTKYTINTINDTIPLLAEVVCRDIDNVTRALSHAIDGFKCLAGVVDDNVTDPATIEAITGFLDEAPF